MKSLAVILLLVCLGVALAQKGDDDSVLGISLGSGEQLGSTIPENGDRNPYGVWVIPNSIGLLEEGNILVSNFNDANNLQGRGSTILQFRPDGTSQVFAEIHEEDLPKGLECPGGIGLTAALATLRRGWVIVGSLPTLDGTVDTASPGCLLILDSRGNVVSTLTGDDIQGPWELEILDLDDSAYLFISNVFDDRLSLSSDSKSEPELLNSGFVLRLLLDIPESDEKSGLFPTELSRTRIGSDFALRADAAALLIGPTGLALSADYDQLFVADTLFNRIAAIPNPLYRDDTAYAGRDISANLLLNLPLGLLRASNNHLLTVNGGDGLLIELNREGRQLDSATITLNGAGSLFDLDQAGNIIYFVDDTDNVLARWVLPE